MLLLSSELFLHGCAAKLPAGLLRKALDNMNWVSHPNLLVGAQSMDDAAVWDNEDGSCSIHSLDFFTPIVDDPFDFGRIAATNAISDIYAMGGDPLIALTILGFPSSSMDPEILNPLMAGAQKAINDSGAVLCGGHSIDNDSLLLGFSVSGKANKNSIWSNAGAQTGDCLILTKGLGTGTITSALKNNEAQDSWVTAAVDSMCLLNRVHPLIPNINIHAATDITGFGLAGHAMQMAISSNVTFEFDMHSIPAIDGAYSCLEKGVLNKAHKTNESYIDQNIDYKKCSSSQRWLTLDPQTSGGLLLSVKPSLADEVCELLLNSFPKVAQIGRVIPRGNKTVLFKGD